MRSLKSAIFSSIFLFLVFTIQSQELLPTPKIVPDTIINTHQLHIYIMAGQSNMAGRGKIEPGDTIINSRVISMDLEGNWVYAQEPLHHYEPNRRGLDCGKSFGEYMASVTPDEVLIALVPVAIGGSSVDQWLNDDEYRGVQLFTNFEQKTKLAMEKGIVKGIIWHQGESDARENRYAEYREKLEKLFSKMRYVIANDELPIMVGELGGFWVREKNPVYAAEINNQLHQLANTNHNIDIIKTEDLMHKGDTLHFDATSLRIMGERYGAKMIGLQYGAEEGAIRNNIRAFSKNIMEGQFDLVSKMYTDDAKIFPPNNSILQGTDQILEYYQPGPRTNSRITFHKVDPVKIEILGEKAIDHGIYQGKSVNDSGEESKWKGKYIIIWKKVDEVWKIEMDIWNRKI